MGHAILTGRSTAILAAATGFFYYLSTGHSGPWAGKYDLPPIARERSPQDIPEFAAQFTPESHPGIRRGA